MPQKGLSHKGRNVSRHILRGQVRQNIKLILIGKFHDQGDAKQIVIRGQLWSHNDTPCGRLTPGRPIGRPGIGYPQGVFGGFSYY
jgi:hypothetical protein